MDWGEDRSGGLLSGISTIDSISNHDMTLNLALRHSFVLGFCDHFLAFFLPWFSRNVSERGKGMFIVPSYEKRSRPWMPASTYLPMLEQDNDVRGSLSA